MANKVILGNRPKNFKKTVTFPMLDGTEGSIDVVFVYRTRTEFGKFVDEARESAKLRLKTKEDASSPDQAEGSWEEVHSLGIEANADHLIACVESWNLDVDPSREAFEQLANELPGAANAIFETYRLAITEGRLGN
jgi:hypothetical protein